MNDEKSKVAREIDLEENWVYARTLMIQEPLFSLLVVPALIVPKVVVQAPIVIPPITTMSENVEPVL
jgi:hypothetical protein